jgi:hypothetical protein
MTHVPATAMAPAIKIVGSVTMTVPTKVANADNTFMAAVVKRKRSGGRPVWAGKRF